MKTETGTTPEKLVNFFTESAGALLVTLVAIVAVGNLAHPTLVLPRDPILMISMRTTLWIIASLAFGVAMVCFFGKQIWLKTFLILWLAFDWFLYLSAVFWFEPGNGLGGHLGGLADAFDLHENTAYWLLKIAFFYLLAGSSFTLLKLRAVGRTQPSSGNADELVKMLCPFCSGKIKFSIQNVGQQIPCPHCKVTITLCRPKNFKMPCFFCQGNVEFPDHAIGEKIACPHCKMDITLKEPA